MSPLREAVATVDYSASHQPASVRESIIKEFRQSDDVANTAIQTKFEELSEKKYAGKRAIDLIFGSFALLLFLVAYPCIALGIKLSSKGPVIFKQSRTGQNGDKFTCFKFRTMHQINLRRIDGKPIVTQKNDKRVFFFGLLLRKMNLDELPQIINVLKGDMSLVGPRPYPLEECKHWNDEFEDHFYRYSVQPGITGLAQVNHLRGGTYDIEHMRKRLDKDLIYVEKQSFLTDIKILLVTVLQMLKLNTKAY